MSTKNSLVLVLLCAIVIISQPLPTSSDIGFKQTEDRFVETLEHTTSEFLPMIWYHDCSNLTAFSGIGDNSWPHDSVVSVTFGSVKCSGTYFYSDDVGSGTGHHGPLYYHALRQPFELSDFVSLNAEFEIGATAVDRRGWIRVGLHASNNATIAMIQVADPWAATNGAYVNSVYKFSNGTLTETPQSSTYPAPFHNTLTLFRNSSGLYTTYPGIDDYCLLKTAQMEESRSVEYVSIQFNGYDTDPLCETFRLHNINLTTRCVVEFPLIDSPADIGYESGTTGHVIHWVPSALEPDSYSVFRDGSVQEYGPWNGSVIEVYVDGLALGVHNLTLAVTARCGNSALDCVFVQVVDTTPPQKTSGANDVAYIFGETGNTLAWSFYDLNPDRYEILVDGNVEVQENWGGGPISFSADGFAVGEHNVTIRVFDESGNSGSDVAYVRVETHPPIIEMTIVFSLFGVGGTIVFVVWKKR